MERLEEKHTSIGYSYYFTIVPPVLRSDGICDPQPTNELLVIDLQIGHLKVKHGVISEIIIFLS